MNRTTGILVRFMVDGIVGCKRAAQRHKRFPFIAHQMSLGVDSFGKNPIGLGLTEVLDPCGSRFASGRADA